MRTLRTVLLFACLLVAIAPPAPAADLPSFTTVDVPTAAATEANAINNAGQIVGVFQDAANKWHGFVTVAGAFTTIDAPGATATYAYGVNSSGVIVGTFKGADGNLYAYVRTPAGAFTTLDALRGPKAYANGVDDAGQIVGAVEDTGGVNHAFVRDRTGAVSTFLMPNVPSGAGGTFAFGVDSAGRTIVGYFWDAGRLRSYLRAPGGAFTVFDAPGAIATATRGINDAGRLVGAFDDAGGKRHGYVATR